MKSSENFAGLDSTAFLFLCFLFFTVQSTCVDRHGKLITKKIDQLYGFVSPLLQFYTYRSHQKRSENLKDILNQSDLFIDGSSKILPSISDIYKVLIHTVMVNVGLVFKHVHVQFTRFFFLYNPCLHDDVLFSHLHTQNEMWPWFLPHHCTSGKVVCHESGI